MSTFATMDVARTGVGFAGFWMETISHNLANLNTVRPAGEEPFRAHMLVAQTLGPQPFAPNGSGVAVGAIVESDAEAAQVYEPENPLADENGYVQKPAVDLAAQMNDLILANRTYQANLKVIESGREAYASALRIGQQ